MESHGVFEQMREDGRGSSGRKPGWGLGKGIEAGRVCGLRRFRRTMKPLPQGPGWAPTFDSGDQTHSFPNLCLPRKLSLPDDF